MQDYNPKEVRFQKREIELEETDRTKKRIKKIHSIKKK